MIDLLVAGGGPAGMAAAIHSARAGLETVVVDRRPGPIDKACGEGLMPHTVRQLESIGVPLRGKAFRGLAYQDTRRRVEAHFRSGSGLGVRRTALSEALHETATASGVRIVKGEFGEITQDETSVRCGDLQARYLLAADGLHSPIRRSLGLDRPAPGRRRWGIRRHYQVAPWSDTVEVFWAHDTEAYVTPVAEDMVGVAILTSRQGKFGDHLLDFPELMQRLDGVPHGSDRAAGPLRQRVRGRTAGRVMLIGDAAGYVDALTGEGMGIAFGSAELAVRCAVAGTPQAYDRQWRAMSRRYRVLTAGLLYASAVRPVRAMIVPAADALPRVFGGIVNLLAY
ncbi:NAD(P)/FAD-dependent oxidoreductase [Mycolicibacterium sp.]|uniref:NAD(P)/FAD-dependent oxidoreductase n=1 Tax=Mycolicibacterium sp. TaxID=2320850 RepID=UPI0028AEB618|nr:NAD(P)/FAD-dependent oxidoreductase [Mycolicibacterium sp.]